MHWLSSKGCSISATKCPFHKFTTTTKSPSWQVSYTFTGMRTKRLSRLLRKRWAFLLGWDITQSRWWPFTATWRAFIICSKTMTRLFFICIAGSGLVSTLLTLSISWEAIRLWHSSKKEGFVMPKTKWWKSIKLFNLSTTWSFTASSTATLPTCNCSTQETPNQLTRQSPTSKRPAILKTSFWFQTGTSHRYFCTTTSRCCITRGKSSRRRNCTVRRW